MYGTLRGALAGRKIAFDRDSFKATVDGRISGVGNNARANFSTTGVLPVPPTVRFPMLMTRQPSVRSTFIPKAVPRIKA